jgi:hypothetical protein
LPDERFRSPRLIALRDLVSHLVFGHIPPRVR